MSSPASTTTSPASKDDDECLVDDPLAEGASKTADKSLLNIERIYEFAKTVDLHDVEALINRQITMNSAISEEGLKNPWGSQVGTTILESEGDSLRTRMVSAAAAGSDARMAGSPLPVVINSGSGNQGIAVSMPVITYARDKEIPHEDLVRALVLSNLISIHQKRYIGDLSAYCGAIPAGTAGACGIAFLEGASPQSIGHLVANSLDTVGGIVCDGAKASCASKIAMAVRSGLTAYDLEQKNRNFPSGEGLVEEDYEDTIRNFGSVAKNGMKDTDVEILNLMIR